MEIQTYMYYVAVKALKDNMPAEKEVKKGAWNIQKFPFDKRVTLKRMEIWDFNSLIKLCSKDLCAFVTILKNLNVKSQEID